MEEVVTQSLHTDEAFLYSVDLDGKWFRMSPIVRSFEKNPYILVDNTLENIYPMEFTAKFQTHQNDSPT